MEAMSCRETIYIVRHTVKPIRAATMSIAAISAKVFHPLHSPEVNRVGRHVYLGTSMQPASIVLCAFSCGDVVDQEQFLRNHQYRMQARPRHEFDEA